MSEYLVVIEHEGEAWGAYCPDLPGVGVVGDSQEEVEQLIRGAITLHLEGLRKAGEPIPEPIALPVTANGRIFPRDDLDLWEFEADAGQTVTALVLARSLNSPPSWRAPTTPSSAPRSTE